MSLMIRWNSIRFSPRASWTSSPSQKQKQKRPENSAKLQVSTQNLEEKIISSPIADAMIQVHQTKWCKQKNWKKTTSKMTWQKNCSSFFVGFLGWWFNDNVMTVLDEALPLQQQPCQSRGGAPWRCLGRRISCASRWTRSRGFAVASWDVSMIKLMDQCISML